MTKLKFILTNVALSAMSINFLVSPASAAMSGALTLLENSDAKYAALGEAGTAASNDIAAMNYNPAGLNTLKTGQASFLYQKGLAEDAYGRFMIGSPTKNGSSFGLSLGYYNAGTLEVSDGNQTQQLTAQQDYVLGLGYARRLGRFDAGITGKYLRSTLVEEFTANTLALDMGLQTAVSSRLRMGASIQNLGRGIKYLNETDPLPTTYRIGAAYLLIPNKNSVTLLMDVPYMVNERETRPALGLEVALGLLAIRGGYRDVGQNKEISIGTGFLIGRSSLDYAFGLANDLDASHRVSFNMRFGGSSQPAFVKQPSIQTVKTVKTTTPVKTEKVASVGKSKGSKPTLGSLEAPSVSRSQKVVQNTKRRNVYTVKDGDTLATIAKKEYGTAANWKTIYSANKHLIDDPKKIETGQKIVLP